MYVDTPWGQPGARGHAVDRAGYLQVVPPLHIVDDALVAPQLTQRGLGIPAALDVGVPLPLDVKFRVSPGVAREGRHPFWFPALSRSSDFRGLSYLQVTDCGSYTVCICCIAGQKPGITSLTPI